MNGVAEGFMGEIREEYGIQFTGSNESTSQKMDSELQYEAQITGNAALNAVAQAQNKIGWKNFTQG